MNMKASKEETDLLRSFENEEWQSVGPGQHVMENLKNAAKATIQQKKRINIRISESDLNKIRIKAIEEGIPYQTLISSILHKYADGKLNA